MNTERMEWIPQELLNQWQQHLQEYDRSAGTVKKYTQAVARFLTWYEAEEQAGAASILCSNPDCPDRLSEPPAA